MCKKICLASGTLLAILSIFCLASSNVSFGDRKSFKIKIPKDIPIGAVIFESDFSQKHDEEYDTILIQGEMPDPNIQIEVRVKKKTFIFETTKTYTAFVFKRFSNGRFWAKFKVDPTRNEFKFSVINRGVKSQHVLIIYEVEVFKEKKHRYENENYPEETGSENEQEEINGLPQNIPFKLIRRKQWNAHDATEPYIKHHPHMFTIHHTAGRFPKTQAEAIEEVQFIQDYHQNGHGWIDIGYHFLLGPLGNIYEGRPIDAVGAHVKEHNTNNVGISIMGNYHPPISDTPTVKTFESFITLGKYLKNQYSVKRSSFYAHRELGKTSCPGDNIYSQMKLLRDSIFTSTEAASVQVEAPPLPDETTFATNAESLKQLLMFRQENR